VQFIVDRVTMSAGGRVLFRDLRATVVSGESLALMGPSGSGKSTLIGGIAGLIPIDAGEILRENESAGSVTHWIFQSAPLLLRRTAVENVALVAEIRGVPRDLAKDRAYVALEELGLGRHSDIPAFKLSGGEKQRVAVAGALVSEASVVLADEPTSSLDPESRDYVIAALQRMAAAGAVVVVATHDWKVSESCTYTVALVEVEVS
jgi:ABC-type lipoprotein export system ATPase subunit